MSSMRFIFVTGLFLIGLSQLSQAQTLEQRPPQFVLISFDGSYTTEMWQATREVALKNQATVTHFISGVDFLIGSTTRSIPGATDWIYKPPRWTGGRRSDIGFGGTKSQLEERLRQIQKSLEAGMEIGGHANGHFNGSTWTEQEWVYEFNWFHKLVLEVFSINSLNPSEVKVSESAWQRQLLTQMKSFRAPYLGRGEGLWNALGRTQWDMLGRVQNHRYTYDASDVTRNTAAWPEKSPKGFWYFRMATIPVTELGRNVLSMDYNFYVAHSDDPNNPKDKPEKVKEFEEQMYQAYIKWFLRNYYGNRAPLNIGHHFSTWNLGAYWKALQRFMRDVCTQPEVRCVQGQELVAFLEAHSPSQIQKLARGEFHRDNLPKLAIGGELRLASIKKAPGPVTYPFQSDNWVRLPGSSNQAEEYFWYLKFQDFKLENSSLNLIELAKKGVTRVDLVAKTTGNQEVKVLNFRIDWDPISNKARLIWIQDNERTNAESYQGCPPEAHQERVDLKYLKYSLSKKA
jgi:hypothetical protein